MTFFARRVAGCPSNPLPPRPGSDLRSGHRPGGRPRTLFHRLFFVPTSIEFNLEGIGHVISDRSLEVPVYQRSYAWEAEQVAEYWADLSRALASSADEYFMGTIVTAGGEGRHVVIDGQQRLATTSIFLAVIRDAYESRRDGARASGIHDRFLTVFDLDSAQKEPRLRLNSEDRQFFQEAVIDGIAPSTEVASHRRLLAARDLLAQRLEGDLAEQGDAWLDRLGAWVKLLNITVKVIVIDVPEVADGFVIFETLNDRGAPLTISDLIRNFLMSRAAEGDAVGSVEDDWTRALLFLGLQDESSVFVDFLRQFWSSRHGAVREKDLFAAIRAKADTPDAAVAFAGELPQAARRFAALLDSTHDLWDEYPAEARQAIEALLRLDLKQYRPLALAVLEVFPADEAAVTLRALVSWVVRGLFAGGTGGGAAERAYGTAAMKVRSEELSTADDVLRQLIPLVPTDREFRQLFARARVSRVGVARYLLTAIELHARGHDAPELVNTAVDLTFRVQQVIPKTAEWTDWPGVTEDDLKSLIPRLGNAVLTSPEDPSLGGLERFDERSQAFGQANAIITREIAEYATWGGVEIDERQHHLAERAVVVWPRTPQR
jgi:hypothetical protein